MQTTSFPRITIEQKSNVVVALMLIRSLSMTTLRKGILLFHLHDLHILIYRLCLNRLPGGTVNPECDYSLEYVSCNAKSEYGIRNLLVWHTLSGYWAGVQPADSDTNSNGKLAKYEARLTFPVLTASMKRMAVSGDLDREPFSTHGVGLVPNHLIADFFHDYHSSLRSMGVDGVKVYLCVLYGLLCLDPSIILLSG